MPLHNWDRVPAGLFHHFHQDWSIEIARTLNRGGLPKGLSALVEQRAGVKEADVLAIERWNHSNPRDIDPEGTVATVESPATRIVRRIEDAIYADRANRIVIKHHLGRIVAVIEILSPGNKSSRAALRDFVEKTVDFLRAGVHVLVIDVFLPTSRDPAGIHKAIWDEFVEEEFSFPAGKDRTLVSYKTGDSQTAYVEPITIGDELTEMPLFVTSDLHVKVALEATYQATWNATPEALREAVETGILPDAGDL